MFGFSSRKKKEKNRELALDEVFLDSSNLPGFDRTRLEGRLEAPIREEHFALLSAGAALLLLILLFKAGTVGVVNGALYAEQSEKNRLRPEIVFAERGAIVDRNGIALAENTEGDEGFPRRTYEGTGFGHLLGYVSYPEKDSAGNYYETDIEGVAGIEAAFNARLAGENGRVLVEEDALGTTLSEGIVLPPRGGETLTLSVDAKVQKALYSAVANVAEMVPFQGGAGVVMDVQNGEIIALVSYPEYDPNVLSSGAPADIISSYQTDARGPYLDRAVSGLYTPGSIIKPLIAAAAHNDGIISPETEIVSTGSLVVPNPYDPERPTIFRDWKAHGATDMRRAIAVSSDVYFYTIGGGFGNQKGLGIERLSYWYRAFGLSSKTGIELFGEAEGFIPTPKWKEETYGEPWLLGNTYHTSIGQYAMQITPLEAVRAIAAVANGGKLLSPHLVKDAPLMGETVAIAPEGLAIAREGMRLSVVEGTAVGLNAYPEVQAAAKTGTAQLGMNNEWYNSWVVGFFPYEAPKYAFVVVMEKGPAGNSTGGVYVMSQVFSSMQQTAPEYFE